MAGITAGPRFDASDIPEILWPIARRCRAKWRNR